MSGHGRSVPGRVLSSGTERATVATSAIGMAIVLLAVVSGVELALGYYARTVVAGAASDGAAAAARRDAGRVDGERVVSQLLTGVAPSLILDHEVDVVVVDDRVEVTVRATTATLLPSSAGRTVEASAAAARERFLGQGRAP